MHVPARLDHRRLPGVATGRRAAATAWPRGAWSLLAAVLVPAIAATVAAAPAPAGAPDPELPAVPIYHLTHIPDAPVHTATVAGLGIAVDHGARRDGALDVVATGTDLQALTAAGVPFDVQIVDLAAFYAERAAARSHLWDETARAAQGGGFGFGSMGGYYTFAELLAKLDEMRANYPTLVSAREMIMVTIEGRGIWLTKISDNPDIEEGEPAILYTGLTHAREPQGMATLVYAMFHLLENYGIDPEVTYLVDNREMYFIPCLNPDGYVYNETTNPQGGGMWRKNRRDNGDGTFGVDLNRNYGYLWGYNNQGSSPNPGSQTYRGTAPFSELETSGVRFFHQGRTIWNAFHYHAYGRLEIHPFGYEHGALPPPADYALFLLYGGDISAMNGYMVGNASGTVGYLVNGDAVDWSYGEQTEKNKVFAFTPEVGSSADGFWPDPSRIVPLAEENLGPNLYYAWIAGARVALVGVEAGPEVPRGAYADVVTTLTNIGLGAAADDVTVVLATSDPYVTDIVNPPSFPAIVPLAVESNAGDPNRFEVSAAAPLDHVIELQVSVLQGDVALIETSVQVTVIEGTTAVAGASPAIGARLDLAARPNPFNPRTELAMDLVAGGRTRLAIYDIGGRLRRVLVDGERQSGRHRVPFDGRDAAGHELPSGVYIARLESAGGSAAARLVVLR